MLILRIICDLCFLAGLIFALAGTLGILKMPDFFSRMQASTCLATMGTLGVTAGGVLYAIFGMHSAGTAVKVAIVGVLILVTNPIASNVLTRGAYRSGIRPEKELVKDDLGRDFE